MKKEIPSALVISILGALFIGFLLSSLLVKGAKPVNVTSVPAISSSFPDVKNDSNYNSFLNTNALDPTQVVPVGNSQNNSPFSQSQ